MTGIATSVLVAGVPSTPLQGAGAILVDVTLTVVLLGSIAAFGLGLRETFLDAGRSGWKALVPVYNLYVAMRIVGYTSIWAFPGIGVVARQYARCFGRGKWFGVGLTYVPWVFLPLLAYGETEYQGPIVDGDETRRLIERHKHNARRGWRNGFRAAFAAIGVGTGSRWAWFFAVKGDDTVTRDGDPNPKADESPVEESDEHEATTEGTPTGR